MIPGNIYIIYTTLTKPKPKDKITLCVCATENLFFWINTGPRVHNVGQFPLMPDDHDRALTHPCYLDLSRLTTFPPRELAAARDRDTISQDLAARIVRFLTDTPPKTLPPRHLALALHTFSALIPADPAKGDAYIKATPP